MFLKFIDNICINLLKKVQLIYLLPTIIYRKCHCLQGLLLYWNHLCAK